jgi:anaerobic selenocysteine-containing dehydrogenase
MEKSLKPTPPQVHRRACHLCEAICGVIIETDGEEIGSIRGDDSDPFSRGHICPKAVALKDIQNDPDRLRRPVQRIGNEWQEISWQQAIETVTSRLAAIKEQHGANAIGVYQGNPNVHNWGMMTHGANFLGLLKTRNRFSATSVDQLPHQLVAYWMFGHQLLIPIPDIDHTDYLLMLGANPLTSNGSLMTVPDVAKRLKALQARGGRVVTVDPRKTETAKVADRHVFIKPGTDIYFLLAIINTLVAQRLAKPGRLIEISDGLNEALEAIRDITPAVAQTLCGIDAAEIETIAREFAAAERAVCYGRMGISTQVHGSLCQWAIQLLNLLTGNLDAVGGSLVTLPALDLLTGPTSRPGSYKRWESRVSKRPEALGEFPSALMAEEILTQGDGQIRAMVTMAGNPVLSTPNGRQLDRAFESLEFMVAIDLYINETTRHADIILPTTAPLEHDHYDLIFNIFAVRNTAKYSAALFEKPTDGFHDWELMDELAKHFAAKTGQTVKPAMPPQMLLDFGLQMGPYGAATEHKLSLEKLKAHPEGIDLGPLKPSFPQRLQTASKRIQCAPEEIIKGMRKLCNDLRHHNPAEQGLRLIGRRDVRSNNSWMHNYERLVKGTDRCTLLVNPDDLAELQGNADIPAQRGVLASRVGEIEVRLQASTDMMRGVVCLPHGWGHQRPGIRMETASQHPGVSLNDITDELLTDPISGNAALNGVPVTLRVSAV